MDIIPIQTSLYVTFPPEILEAILKIATKKDDDYVDSHRYLPTEWESNVTGILPFDPVSTARACSQVCRIWRDIAINSQLLWAPLFDTYNFPDPLTSGTMWWDEVVRRAGPNTPISLRSANVADFSEDGNQSIITAYVLPLLHSHRTRIELLDLRLKLEDELQADERWHALLEIGTAAREVSLQVFPFPDVIFSDREELKVSVFVKSPLRFIDTLTICAPMRWCDTFYVLSHMPQLRRLSILNEEHDPDAASLALYSQTARISMPFLKELYLSNMFIDFVHLLPRLTTAPGCKMKIAAENIFHDFPLQSGVTPLTFVEALRSRLFNILMGCTTIELDLDPCHICLEGDPDRVHVAHYSPNGHYPSEPLLKALTITITNDEVPIPDWVHLVVLHALGATKLPELKKLSITWDWHGEFMTTFPRSPHFLSSLTSLTTLRVGPKVLSSIVRYIMEMTRRNQNRPPVFFPLLDTVCVYPQQDDPHYVGHVGLLRIFLDLRAFMRAPIHLSFEGGVIRERMVQEFGLGSNQGLLSIRARQ